jgi:hypothetical protein
MPFPLATEAEGKFITSADAKQRFIASSCPNGCFSQGCGGSKEPLFFHLIRTGNKAVTICAMRFFPTAMQRC